MGQGATGPTSDRPERQRVGGGGVVVVRAAQREAAGEVTVGEGRLTV